MPLTLYFAAGTVRCRAWWGSRKPRPSSRPCALVPNGDRRRRSTWPSHPRPGAGAGGRRRGHRRDDRRPHRHRPPVSRGEAAAGGGPGPARSRLRAAGLVRERRARGLRPDLRPERYTRDASAWPALKPAGGRTCWRPMPRSRTGWRTAATGCWARPSLLADPYALVLYRWATRLEVDLADYPAISAHAARVQARPSVQRALAYETSDRTSCRPDPSAPLIGRLRTSRLPRKR